MEQDAIPVKKNVKGLILKESFKLLLEHNIEKVTVPVLEQSTNVKRGGLFYHINSKEDLFNQVIEIYFFSSLNIFYPVDSSKVYSLKEYIELKENQLSQIFLWFNQENVSVNPFLGFSHIISQAKKYYPNFTEQYQLLVTSDEKQWSAIIEKGIENKEIRSELDVETMVSLFRSLYTGACFSYAYEYTNSALTKATYPLKFFYNHLCL